MKMTHKFKKRGNEYTLFKSMIDIKAKESKTIYKQLTPTEYSEHRIAAMKEIKQREERLK